jgi:hypothetical protein
MLSGIGPYSSILHGGPWNNFQEYWRPWVGTTHGFNPRFISDAADAAPTPIPDQTQLTWLAGENQGDRDFKREVVEAVGY